MRPGRVALLLAALVAGALAFTAVFSLTQVPQNEVGLVVRSGQVVRRLTPGLHLRRFFDQVVRIPAAPREFNGSLRVSTREGAEISIPYHFSLDLASAGTVGVAPIAVGLAAGTDLDAVVGGLVQDAASGRQAGAGSIESAVGQRLAGVGLVPGSLTLRQGRAASSTRNVNPLKAAWSAPAWSVLLIGVDSADWDLMTPLIESGALPHLKALRDRGAWSVLHSMKPTLSPILWTTIATGRRPEDHGVIDFLMKDPASGAEVPISRMFRRVKALWNIASDFDIPNITVAWWATWPAERVTGSMVTDRVAYSLFELPAAEPPAGMVYPDSLAEEISRVRVDVDEMGYEDLKAIVDVPRPVFDQARAAISSPDGYRNPVSHLLKILASTRTYHNIALSLLKRQQAGLTLVYYEGLDEVNHRFAQYLPPSMGLARATDPRLAAAFSEAVPAFYRLQDRLIGELVAAAPAQTVVMVVSDHGFANAQERPVDVPPDIEGKPGLWHTLDGVFIVAGPPIRPGRLATAPELLDVAPTLLALLGLPAAADMPGHPITEIFLPGAEPKQPSVKVASYEEIGEQLQAVAGAGSSSQDPEMIAKLTALGYVQSSAASAAAVGTGTPTYHINAGSLLVSQNQLDRARDEFLRARDLAPRYDQPLLGLAQVELLKGRPGEALEYLEEALKVVAAPQPALLTRAAQVYMKAGQQKRGLAFLGGLELTGRPEAFRLAAMGMLYEGVGQEDQALTSYRRALEVDPSVERALYGAYVLLRKRGELDTLASLLENSLSVESIPVAVRAANWLALTRELQGRRPEARGILSTALAKAPDDMMTLINLGSMLLRDDMARESLVHLDNAYRRQPESFEVLVNLVVAHGKLGDLDRARGYFAEGEKVAKRPALYNAMAFACYLNGAKKDERFYLTQSLAIDPNQQEARRLQEQLDRGPR